MITSGGDAVVTRTSAARRFDVDPYSRITVTREWIGPEEATAMLARNEDNYRNEIESNQQKIDADMNAGRFELSPDCITITESDRVMNGAHRLRGVVNTGKRLQFLVARNWPDKYIHAPFVDRGSKRTSATDLAHLGTSKAVSVAAGIRILSKLYMNLSSNNTTSNFLSDASVSAAFQRAPELVACIQSANIPSVVPDSLLGSFLWLAAHDDQPAAQSAFAILNKTQEASSTNPFVVLREYLVTYRRGSGTKAMRPDNDHMLRAMFAAWEAFLADRTLRQIRPLVNMRLPEASKVALDRLFDGLM